MNTPESTKIIATMSRRVAYDDGCGTRCEVSYDSTYRLGGNPDRYVAIKSFGEEAVLVELRDVPFLIDALNEAMRLDEQVSA